MYSCARPATRDSSAALSPETTQRRMSTPSSSARAAGAPDGGVTPRGELLGGVGIPVPPGRRFRQDQVDDIVGVPRRVARAVVLGDDVVGGRDQRAEAVAGGIPLAAKRRDERRQFGVHDSPESLVSLREAQQAVDRWIGQYKEGYFSPLTNLARLTEEVGELAREINHRFGEKTKKQGEAEGSLAMELADILFVVVCIANSQGIDLDQAFAAMMQKVTVRDAHRWTEKTE